MRGRRTLLAAAGAGALLLAVALAGGGDGPIAAVAALFGNDYLLVAALGGLAVVLAAPVLASGRAANLRQFEMPTPERPTTAPPAGSGFDEACGSWRVQLPVYGTETRERLHERLLRAAAETERRRGDCGRERALDRVRSGEWGGDDVAAAFLADGRTPPSLWTGALTTGEPPFGRAARLTAREIARLNENPARRDESRTRSNEDRTRPAGDRDRTDDENRRTGGRRGRDGSIGGGAANPTVETQ